MRTLLKAATLSLSAIGLCLGGAAIAADENATPAGQTAASHAAAAAPAGEATAPVKKASKMAATHRLYDSYKSTAQLDRIAHRLVGKQVTDKKGGAIGNIEDVAMGPDHKAYAIVSVGQFLGQNGKNVPIHMGELRMHGDNVIMMSQSSKHAIGKLPTYDKIKFKSLVETAAQQKSE